MSTPVAGIREIAGRPFYSLAFVIGSDYHRLVTASELKRKLAKAGCTFEEGTKHTVVYYLDKRSLLPRHPSKEMKIGTVRGIFKKLGLKESEV